MNKNTNNYQRKYNPDWFLKMTDLKRMDRIIPWDSYGSWYNNLTIRYKLFPYLKNREFALLVPKCFPEDKLKSTRFLKITNVQSFDFFFKVTGMNDFETKYGFFYSMAKYETGIPFVPYNKEKRSVAKTYWIENHWKEMVSYDFYLDVDGDEKIFDLTKDSAKYILNLLMELKFPFKLRYSGQGFHFITDYEILEPYIPLKWKSFNPNLSYNIYKLFGLIAKWISNQTSEFIDLGIYDPRRVLKIPFSLALYETGVYVCLPITNLIQFDNFDLKSAHIQNFILIEKIKSLEDKYFELDYLSPAKITNPEILLNKFFKEVKL